MALRDTAIVVLRKLRAPIQGGLKDWPKSESQVSSSLFSLFLQNIFGRSKVAFYPKLTTIVKREFPPLRAERSFIWRAVVPYSFNPSNRGCRCAKLCNNFLSWRPRATRIARVTRWEERKRRGNVRRRGGNK